MWDGHSASLHGGWCYLCSAVEFSKCELRNIPPPPYQFRSPFLSASAGRKRSVWTKPLTLSLPSSRSRFSQLLKEKCIREVVRVGEYESSALCVHAAAARDRGNSRMIRVRTLTHVFRFQIPGSFGPVSKSQSTLPRGVWSGRTAWRGGKSRERRLPQSRKMLHLPCSGMWFQGTLVLLRWQRKFFLLFC